jgi:DNA-binding response OmpR family regulator
MNKRMLIVDDDKILCEELVDFFKETGFHVDHALMPADGLELFFKNDYDILLLDFKMPQFDGIEFLVRTKERVRGVNVFLMSGSLSISRMLEEKNLTAAVVRVFVKPFDINVLQAAIRDAVNI